MNERCGVLVGTGETCGKPAHFKAEGEDRYLFMCAEHYDKWVEAGSVEGWSPLDDLIVEGEL